MDRSESKYFRTAARMDEAFLALLEKKDFAYITVKELCAAAGVNRSTFYLHYETLANLLEESAEYMMQQFLSYMQQESEPFIRKIPTCPLEELYLITPRYLTPYLNYVKDHQRLLRTALENAAVLHLDNSYAGLFRHVLEPILARFRVPEQERTYRMDFYIHGIMAIINRWLQGGCAESVAQITAIVQSCIPQMPQSL